MIQQLLVNGLIAGSIYALIAVGFAIIYGTVRFFHFAHGAVYAVGAYLAWFTISNLGLPSAIGVVLACLAAGCLGLLFDVGVYRPLRARRSPNMVFLLASFGLFVLVQNALQLVFGTDIKSLRLGSVEEGHHFLGAVITNTQIGIVVACAFLALTATLFLERSRLGKAIRAVSDDAVAASIVGIDSERIVRVSFFLGSLLAGAAGILVSLETNIEPTMGLNAILKGIIAAVIGGIGSIPGALAGGLLIGLAENLGLWGISAGWKDAIAFVILVAFLLLRPAGLFGRESDSRSV